MYSFLICPVRGLDPEAHASVVKSLEAGGYTVYWPPRDTDQKDPTGFRICRDNAAAIASADIVHVIWDGKSQGCLFDLGVAFALGKKIAPIRLPEPTEGKSFQNMVRAWAIQGNRLILDRMWRSTATRKEFESETSLTEAGTEAYNGGFIEWALKHMPVPASTQVEAG